MPDTKLPFLQDIVHAGTSYAEWNDGDFYLMLTNADICLGHNFFTELSSDLARSKRKALSINRKVLPHSGFDVSSSLNDVKSTPHSIAMKLWQQAHDLINKGKYAKHGGYDCFIMHASVVRSINFGEQFVGFPYWGTNIDFALHIMADGYDNVKSKETSWGTYHVGSDNNWQTPNMHNPKDDMMTDWKKFSKEDLDNLAWCPVMGFPPPDRNTLQNAINCGKWFRPTSNDTSPMVPAFVNEGYDTVYLRNFAKHLNFTPEGLPEVPWKINSNTDLRQQWIQKWGHPKPERSSHVALETSEDNAIVHIKMKPAIAGVSSRSGNGAEIPKRFPAIQTKNVAIHIMGGSGLCSQLMMLLVIQLYYEKGCHRKFMVDESFFGGYRRSSSEGILTGFFTPQMPVLDELKDRSIFAKKWLPVSAQTGDPFISYGPPISSSSPNSIEDATGSETPLVISGVFSHNGHFRRGLQKLDKMKKTDDNLHSQWDWHYLYYSLIPYACNNFQFNQRTQKEIKEHLLEHNISTSPSTNRKMVGFHIRRSDKVVSGESSKYTAQAYVKKWINSLGEMRNTTAQSFTHCFIASDEFVAVEEFRAALDHEKIPCHVITLTPTARNGTSDAKQRKSTYAETLTFLAEMSVLVEAEYFVGTMSSNVGAFVTLMRSCPAYFRGESLEDYKEKLTKNHYYNSFGVDRDWYTRGMDD